MPELAYTQVFKLIRWAGQKCYLVGRTIVIFLHLLFQGWTALTASGPGDGTLRLLPLIKESISHILLRPFLKDVDLGQIPGYVHGQLIYPEEALHKELFEGMVSIPEMRPGDSIWWHPDLLHR